jgi:alpha-L-fucosidase 2
MRIIKNTLLALLIIAPLIVLAQRGEMDQQRLWYRQPAKNWDEALPVGNGRLGAMIFGGTNSELIQLNEETLWTGGPVDPDPNPGAKDKLSSVRKLLLNGQNGQAVKLMRGMQGPNTNMYQPLANLHLKQDYVGEVTNYRRELDISNAIATTSFDAGGTEFKREIFASFPAQLIIIRLTSTKAKAINISFSLNSELAHKVDISPDYDLILRGKARITSDERRNPKPLIYSDSLRHNGMRYQAVLRIAKTDGKISADSLLRVSGASEILLYISGATSYNGFDRFPDIDGLDEKTKALAFLDGIKSKNFSGIKSAHIADYQHYFNRVSLSLDEGVFSKDEQPTDERLAAYKKGAADYGLEVLYFQYGRYLLISSSREGGIPANLQGIWNPLIRPSWRSNFTTNINVQMNYWPAETTNLSELTGPLIAQIGRWAKNGTETAKNYYGARGWVLHHNSDIWAQTSPVGEGVGDPKWANWSLGSPWISQHLFEHYLFSQDKQYLKQTAYPLMKGAALFCLDWLIEKDGYLVTAPSTSPENSYFAANGSKEVVTIGSTMDISIIRDLFNNVVQAAEILNTDREFVILIKAKLGKLRPLQVGKKGNIQEWYGDFEDVDPQHRHVSHLFGLHPGKEISPLLDTVYSNAAIKTLSVRGDDGTGWSKAWKINFWARLLDGNHAYKMYQELLRTSTLNNLFDTHPPFQIDGNFGATAGVAEMLLQSQLGTLQLLPSLPSAWRSGKVKGLVARGGFVVDMEWSEGKLTTASIFSRKGGKMTILTNEPMGGSNLTKGRLGERYLYSIETKANRSYRLNSELTANR